MPIFNPEIECASRDYLRALQSARLIKMVKNAYENVPFYKAKFDEIGLKPEDIHSIDDITKLPFTVKTDLRDNYPFGLFAVPKGDLVRIHASSGTTGKPTVVGYTQHDIDIWSESSARDFLLFKVKTLLATAMQSSPVRRIMPMAETWFPVDTAAMV